MNLNQGELYALLKKHRGIKLSPKQIRDLMDCQNSAISKKLNTLARFGMINKKMIKSSGQQEHIYWIGDDHAGEI